MLLPNKLFTYQESSLSKFPIILRSLEESARSAKDLYTLHKSLFFDIEEYTETLCCLYALRKIDIDEKGVIFYVEDASLR